LRSDLQPQPGYRLFDKAALLRRVEVIGTARELGLTEAEIQHWPSRDEGCQTPLIGP
jgi:DNA-binding transcriptional MerR regulator